MEYFTLKLMFTLLDIPDGKKHIKAVKLRDVHLNDKTSILAVPYAFFKIIFSKSIGQVPGDVLIVAPRSSEIQNKAEKYISAHSIEREFDHYFFELRPNRQLNLLEKSKLKILFCFLVLLSLFDRQTNAIILLNLYKSIYSFKKQNLDSIYIFGRLNNALYYLFIALISEFSTASINVIMGSSPLYSNRRISYLPAARILCGSKVQLEEIKAYRNTGLFSCKEVEYWGGIDPVCLNQIKDKYDIGIYSSGEWARIEGLIRESNIQYIKEGKHIENKRYRLFYSIMEAIINTFAETKTIKVYLHPFERELVREHSISPPYVSFLNEHKIDYDTSGTDSLESIFECKTGVALTSTIIYERWDHDRSGFLFHNPRWSEYEKMLDPQFLGKYAKGIYTDTDDLIRKLENE